MMKTTTTPKSKTVYKSLYNVQPLYEAQPPKGKRFCCGEKPSMDAKSVLEDIAKQMKILKKALLSLELKLIASN